MQKQHLPYRSPIAELTRRCLSYKRISFKAYFVLVLYYIKLFAALPFSFLQTLVYGKKIRNTRITEPPVFIIGHYRSGTTYLHTLLSKDERFGFFSNYDMVCPGTSLLFGNMLKNLLQSIVRLFNIKTSFFNNKTPDLDEPAEEDRFLVNKGSGFTDYWGFLFPLMKDALKECSGNLANELYFKKWEKEYTNALQLITYKHKGKRLVLKSPPNTMRIKYLLRLFPEARFIYLQRDPYHVFYSMKSLWIRAIQKYCLQPLTEREVEEVVLAHFAVMIDRYREDRMLIPGKNLIELTYERLEANPYGTIAAIYEQLNLPGFDCFGEKLRHQLIKEKNYKKYQYNCDEQKLTLIELRWSKYIRRWKKAVDKELLIKEQEPEVCDATEA